MERSFKHLERSFKRLEHSFKRLERSFKRLERSFKRLERSFKRLERSFKRLERSFKRLDAYKYYFKEHCYNFKCLNCKNITNYREIQEIFPLLNKYFSSNLGKIRYYVETLHALSLRWANILRNHKLSMGFGKMFGTTVICVFKLKIYITEFLKYISSALSHQYFNSSTFNHYF